MPARRKFLRSVDAEFRAIAAVVTSYALPLPSLAFRLIHNGRVVLDLPPASAQRDRAVQILGSDAEPHLEPVDGALDGVRASGFVTRGLRYGSRRNQFFFVNGRLVRDRVLTHAASRACGAFDFEGHPAIILLLDVTPEMVDVNVHPAKTEVRFRDSGSVHVVVEQSIKRALGGAEEGAALLKQPIRDAPLPDLFPVQRYDAPAGAPPMASPLFQRSTALVQPPAEARSATAAVEIPVDLGDLRGRVIGQYRMSYILMDMPGGLRLVDQHVAHERVLYDRYWTRLGSGHPVMQQLLTPILYETGAREAAVLESHLDELRAVGFDIERFSGNTFAIAAMPPELVRHDADSFLKKLMDGSLEEKSSHLTQVRERICASLACQAAIIAGVHYPAKVRRWLFGRGGTRASPPRRAAARSPPRSRRRSSPRRRPPPPLSPSSAR